MSYAFGVLLRGFHPWIDVDVVGVAFLEEKEESNPSPPPGDYSDCNGSAGDSLIGRV